MITLPVCEILPALGIFDGLGLERIATVGYHVVAVRRRGNGTADD